MSNTTPQFVAMCSDEELQRELKVCRNSEFSVVIEEEGLRVTVSDQGRRVLMGFRYGDHWILSVSTHFYDHPFPTSRRRTH